MNHYRQGRMGRLWPFGFLIGLFVIAMSYQPTLIGQGRGGGQGGGHGGGGGPGEEIARNNLSVPAILVNGEGGNNFQLIPEGVVVTPENAGVAPRTDFPIDPDAYYYQQGVHYWQASCIEAVTAYATAAWGDNLTGEAALKTNSPIRVEVGLLAAFPEDYEMTGWNVEKLEPAELDREAAYGTLAIGSLETGFVSDPETPFWEVRVYDGDAHLTIYNIETPDTPVFDEDASAEINSTGRIVYGYNLRVATVGTYAIEFTAPNIIIDNADDGTDSHTITLEIEVTSGGGGGGGNQGNKGGGGPPHRD